MKSHYDFSKGTRGRYVATEVHRVHRNPQAPKSDAGAGTAAVAWVRKADIERIDGTGKRIIVGTSVRFLQPTYTTTGEIVRAGSAGRVVGTAADNPSAAIQAVGTTDAVYVGVFLTR